MTGATASPVTGPEYRAVHSSLSHPPIMSLTLEQMRQDLAKILLEDPADIHDDDNLIDLGLDSMRAMTLASRWQAAGATLDFSEMAAKPTLGAWWAMISG